MSRRIPFKMRKVFDLDDYYVLKQNGWELPSDHTLAQYKNTFIRKINELEKGEING